MAHGSVYDRGAPVVTAVGVFGQKAEQTVICELFPLRQNFGVSSCKWAVVKQICGGSAPVGTQALNGRDFV